MSLRITHNPLALGYNNASGAADHALKFHIGQNNLINQDYYYVNLGGMTALDLGLAEIDVCDTASAQMAIDNLNAAIMSKDIQRAFIGSLVERLQNTILALQVNQETAVSSESAIRDTDMAEAMLEFTRAQILQQASMAMLAQANQLPATVAQLLGEPS